MKESSSSLGSEIKDWVISIAVAVVLALFIRTFVVELYLVDGPSMRPTLQNQERLVVNKFIYRLHAPERGDILIFQYPKDPSRDFIKRVIAIPGDTIEIRDGHVYVNGELKNEPYILSTTRGDYSLATVPEGHARLALLGAEVLRASTAGSAALCVLNTVTGRF